VLLVRSSHGNYDLRGENLMGRPRKTQTEDTHLSDSGTSSKDNRLAAEAERQATVNEERAKVMAETRKAQAATAKFLESKPTDSRTIADTR
jgi:hypothetical protein